MAISQILWAFNTMTLSASLQIVATYSTFKSGTISHVANTTLYLKKGYIKILNFAIYSKDVFGLLQN